MLLLHLCADGHVRRNQMDLAHPLDPATEMMPLVGTAPPREIPTMKPNQLATVSAVVTNAPTWIRTDLASRDEALRKRAEETLAAMITAALASGDSLEEEARA
jgi:hypothetical protein